MVAGTPVPSRNIMIALAISASVHASISNGLGLCMTIPKCTASSLRCCQARSATIFVREREFYLSMVCGLQGSRRLASSDRGAFQLTAKKVRMLHVGCIGGRVDASLIHVLCQVGGCDLTSCQFFCAFASGCSSDGLLLMSNALPSKHMQAYQR